VEQTKEDEMEQDIFSISRSSALASESVQVNCLRWMKLRTFASRHRPCCQARRRVEPNVCILPKDCRTCSLFFFFTVATAQVTAAEPSTLTLKRCCKRSSSGQHTDLSPYIPSCEVQSRTLVLDSRNDAAPDKQS
jgi:hypothetical protein